MANVVVYTSVCENDAQVQLMIDVVKSAVSEGLKLGPISMPTAVVRLDAEHANSIALDTTVFCLYTAPGKGAHHKAQAARILHDSMEKHFGSGIQTEVLFFEHPHENVGLDGQLRANDATAVAKLDAIGNMR